jgi:FkbM family methyltransferase
MKKNIKIFLVEVNTFLLALISKFDGRLFCILCNIYFFITLKKTRFSFDGSIFKAKEDSIFIHFKNKKQGLNVYSNGLLRRAKKIGSTYFMDLITFEDGDFIVDCGANVGDLFFYFKNYLNKNVKYLGIEPSPKEFDSLIMNVGKHSALNAGLWNEESCLNFYVSSDGADSSFIKPLNYTNIIEVKTYRLDKVLDVRIKLLKVEAEGAEPEVLEGALGLFNKIDYISADLGFERGIDQSSTLVPVVNFMLANGFTLVAISHDRICALFKNSRLLD